MAKVPLHILSREDLSARLERIRPVVLRYFKGVVSIVLGGSSGRGAFSFTESDGEVLLLSDFDVIVLCKSIAFASNLRSISLAESSATREADADVTIAVLPTPVLPFAPRTNYYYELCKSRIIHGKDLRRKIRTQSVDHVDPVDGLSIAFNYLHELLRLYPCLRQGPADVHARVKIAYNMRRSLLGALKGLLVRYRVYDIDHADDVDWYIRASKECLRRVPGTVQLLYPRWDSAWSLAAGSSLPIYTNESLFQHWFAIKEFLELLILILLGFDYCRAGPTGEDRLWAYAHAARDVRQNLQFWLLCLAGGYRLPRRDILRKTSVKRRVHVAVWLLSKSVRTGDVDNRYLRKAFTEIDTLPTLLGGYREFSPGRGLADLGAVWRFACPALGF